MNSTRSRRRAAKRDKPAEAIVEAARPKKRSRTSQAASDGPSSTCPAPVSAPAAKKPLKAALAWHSPHAAGSPKQKHSPSSTAAQDGAVFQQEEAPAEQLEPEEEMVVMSRAAVRHAAAAPCFAASDSDHIALVMAALSGNAATDTASAASGPEPAVQSGPHGRQQQFQQLHGLLLKACTDGQGESVYISGLPGTGKSHTVRTVLTALAAQQLPTPILPLYVSCVTLKDSGGVYKVLLQACATQLGMEMDEGCDCAGLKPEAVHQLLIKLLQRAGTASSRGGRKGAKGYKAARATKGPGGGPMLVLVLDELDRLLQGRGGLEELVRLFMMPHAQGVHCCVVGLANSIDITERCLPELKLRGCAPHFMPFGAYLRPQLLAILGAKLSALPWPVYESGALELVSRKVSATTGDTRKALQACRVALRALHQEQLTAIAQEPSEAAAGGGQMSPRGRPSALSSLSPLSRGRSLLGGGTGTGAPPCRPASPHGTHIRPASPSGAHMSPTRCGAAGGTRPVSANWGSPARPSSPHRMATATASAAAGGQQRLQGCSSPFRPGNTSSPGCVRGVGVEGALVGVRHMHAALSRVMYQSGAAASTVHTVRTLPQQHQVHLLALAAAVAGAVTTAAAEAKAEASAAEHGLSRSAYAARWYFGPSSTQKPQTKLSNPFASAPGGAADGWGRGAEAEAAVTPVSKARGGASKGVASPPSASSGDAAVSLMLVPAGAAGKQGDGTPAASRDSAPPRPPSSASAPRAPPGALAGDAARAVPVGVAYDQYRCLCATLYQQPGSEQEFMSTMSLLSHQGLVTLSAVVGGSGFKGGLGGGRGANRALTAANTQLLLKAGVRDIQMALKDNALFKRALSALPPE